MKRIGQFAGAGLIAGMVLGGTPMALAGEFNSEQWKAQSGAGATENTRQGMISKLEEILRPGMSKDEIVALLGKPDIQENNRFEYELGLLGFGVDYAWYVLEFDEDGRLASYKLIQG